MVCLCVAFGSASLFSVSPCKGRERENSALKREGGAETEPLTPLGEKGFIAGVESSGLPHEFPLSGLISGHCWDVTKEEYVDGRWRGKGRSEVEGREARGGCCKGGKGQEYGAVKQIWSKGSRRATVSTSFCSRALQSNHHLSVSLCPPLTTFLYRQYCPVFRHQCRRYTSQNLALDLTPFYSTDSSEMGISQPV